MDKTRWHVLTDNHFPCFPLGQKWKYRAWCLQVCPWGVYNYTVPYCSQEQLRSSTKMNHLANSLVFSHNSLFHVGIYSLIAISTETYVCKVMSWLIGILCIWYFLIKDWKTYFNYLATNKDAICSQGLFYEWLLWVIAVFLAREMKYNIIKQRYAEWVSSYPSSWCL